MAEDAGEYSAESESISVPATRHPLQPIEVYQLTQGELDALLLSSLSARLHSCFASLLFGVGVSFLVSLLATRVDNPKTFASFVAVAIVSMLGFLYCLIRYVHEEVRSHRKRAALRQLGGSRIPG